MLGVALAAPTQESWQGLSRSNLKRSSKAVVSRACCGRPAPSSRFAALATPSGRELQPFFTKHYSQVHSYRLESTLHVLILGGIRSMSQDGHERAGPRYCRQWDHRKIMDTHSRLSFIPCKQHSWRGKRSREGGQKQCRLEQQRRAGKAPAGPPPPPLANTTRGMRVQGKEHTP